MAGTTWPHCPAAAHLFSGVLRYFRWNTARAKTPKAQAPSTREAPNRKLRTKARAMWSRSTGALRFGPWNFSGPSSVVVVLPQRHVCYGGWKLGAWDLKSFRPSHSTENSEEPLAECDRPRSQQVPPCQSALEILCAVCHSHVSAH